MLPSTSTQSKDPSLFPHCGTDPATSCGRPPATTSDESDADFGALFADLNPVEPAYPSPTPDPAVIAMGMPGLVFALPPPPPAFAPLATGVGDVEADAETIDSDVDAGVWSEGAGAALEWTGRGMGTREVEMIERRGFMQGFGRGLDRALAQVSVAEPSEGQPANVDHRTPETPTAEVGQLPASSRTVLVPSGSPAAASEVNMPESAVVFRGEFAAKATQASEAGRSPLEKEGIAAEVAVVSADRSSRAEPWGANQRVPRTLPEEENFAGFEESAEMGATAEISGRKKSFLGAKDEWVASHARSLGTDGAKSAASMASTSLSSPPTPSTSDFASWATSATTAAVARAEAVAETGDAFSSAHEAVEVVLHAVEHVASREQKSVQLSFSVAGEQLAVRVEMRADEVRTTFRTDSSELRAALAQEWQQVSGGATQTERSLRIAPAVFAAAEQSALNAFAGDTHSRGRHPGTPRGETDSASSGSRGRAVAAVVPPASLGSASAPTRSGGSHRLHTLA